MRDLHEAAGAVFGRVRGSERPRHYGDPAAEYRAATGGLAVIDRSHRERWLVRGRDPTRMLTGVVTGTVPPLPPPSEPEGWRGRAEYSTVLTPRGRMVTDLRLVRAGRTEEDGFLLDLPAAGAGAARDHFARYLPPRFASVDEVTGATGMLTLVGPGAAGWLSREALGLRVDLEALEAAAEGDAFLVGAGGGTAAGAAGASGAGVAGGLSAEDGASGGEDGDGSGDPRAGTLPGVLAVRSGEVEPPAWDLVADRATVRALWSRALETGAVPLGAGAWETLRVEAGRPAFGADMDDDTIPVEAGLGERAFDHAKGCYTGQEVIVRIRDRGHVNRHLRRLHLGEEPAPPPGTELWAEGRTRPAGEVRTAVHSPRFGETVALAYVRREVEPPGEVRLGDPEGPVARVEAL